jgi:methionyl-tRNA formyltransferase
MSNSSLKIIFAGTPDFAAVALQALLEQGHSICAVYCQPDRPSGRGKKLIAGPVKQLALEHQISVEQPLNFKNKDDLDRLVSYNADLMIVAAYGLLLPQSVLTTPKYGCINIHASLLPRWRGAAPIQRAIQAGDQETGITIMQMDEGLDTGNMLLKLSCPIDLTETGSALHDKLALLGGKAINQYLKDFNPDFCGDKQSSQLACYAHKLSKQEAEIDWSESAIVIERKIRAFNAWPVSFTHSKDKRIRVWQAVLTNNQSQQQPGSIISLSSEGIEVACGDSKTLLIKHLQPDGAKAMSASDFLNSRRDWFENIDVLGRT